MSRLGVLARPVGMVACGLLSLPAGEEWRARAIDLERERKRERYKGSLNHWRGRREHWQELGEAALAASALQNVKRYEILLAELEAEEKASVPEKGEPRWRFRGS